jgi:hypothetical protein
MSIFQLQWVQQIIGKLDYFMMVLVGQAVKVILVYIQGNYGSPAGTQSAAISSGGTLYPGGTSNSIIYISRSRSTNTNNYRFLTIDYLIK